MNESPLTITHFSTADTYGGAARCAYRIHEGLRALGHTSRMLVSRKDSTDPDVDTVYGTEAGRLANRLAEEVGRTTGRQYQVVPSTRRTLRHAWTQHPSIFQLFNTHGGYLSTNILPKLSARAPVVWWLADMWALTGHCAYSGGCMRWRTGCGSCPDLMTYPGIDRDTTAWLFQQKAKVYAKTDLTIVAPSTWTERMARESPLLGKFPLHRIPNGLDLTAFRPVDRIAARAHFNLPADAPIILFAAHVIDHNVRKGVPQLITALNRATLPPGTTLVLMGEGAAGWSSQVKIETRLLGNLSSDDALAAAYSAADLFAAPSTEDNLPSTVLESMACGVPAVAFDVGGIKDAVRHDRTGYLARPTDVADFANGLETLLADSDRRVALGAAARRLMEIEFSADLQARRFEELYRDLVARRARASH
ncbi:MAG: glycosyltransferase family 4 protein [Gemmatimonadaceae bacterium]